MNAAALIAVCIVSAAPAPPVDFATEIVPVLTRAGCNAGACHGAAAGRGGFRLSLLGGDADFDYESIVHEYEGRRINLSRPEQSLLLAKPTGGMEHGGDVVLDYDGAGAKRLIEWIASGAPSGSTRELVQFEFAPRLAVANQVDDVVSMRTTAQFDNGSAEDVTAWTVFSAADPSAVEINAEAATATVRRRGQHVVIARFLDRVVPSRIVLPLSGTPIDLSAEPRANFIDEEVLAALTLLRLPVSPSVDDATFLRRASLDLTGKLPARVEVEDFLVDDSADKRARLVDRLLAGDAFVDYWTYQLATMLRVHSLPNDERGTRAYHGWLRACLRDGAPWTELARQLLIATGDSHAVGPANFARMAADARAQAELVSQAFLGVRMQCANCHNHPLDRWTQDDYHGLAAVFARLDRGREVRVLSRGAVTNLRTGEPAVPRIPGERYLEGDADHRVEFAEWLTDPRNPYFARAMVNRLWRAMFGRGLVDPTDDLRDTNLATHPELLECLAADFVEHGYDIRHTLRLIAMSETYQRSAAVSGTNGADDRFYSHAYRRPLPPEVLADAIADVTGVADAYGEEPAGTRAIQLFDAGVPAPALDILGRCTRESSCEGAVSGGGLPAKLHLLNGELVNAKITSTAGALHRLIDSGVSDNEIVTEFYRRALSRRPTDDESAYWRDQLTATDSRERTMRLEDFVWSLLNSQEFVHNQ